jgi:LuxR family maltose regulon positive regulatory protein
MLHRIAKQDHLAETIARILSAFSGDDKNLDGDKIPTQSVRHPTLGGSTLVEPLTSRELEVLILLREPLSIKEIALRINVSYETVRRHIANLYGKLGVNRRWDAVARAEELSILPPR